MGFFDIFKKQNNYQTAVFLNAYKKSTPVMSNKDYYKYLNTECGISNPSRFHKQMIAQGYFIQDSDNPNNYILSDKGKAYLAENEECVKIHKYKKLEINWENYSAEKKHYPNLSCDEIVSIMFDKEFQSSFKAKNFAAATNTELRKAQFYELNKNYAQAFKYFVTVLYFDLSGCCLNYSGNMYDNREEYEAWLEYLNKGGTTAQWEASETRKQIIRAPKKLRIEPIENISVYPYFQKKIQKYSDYYNDKIIDDCFEIVLPHNYFNKKTFKAKILEIMKK